jgi:hypothetical protein
MGGMEPDQMVGCTLAKPDRGSNVYFFSLIGASLK